MEQETGREVVGLIKQTPQILTTIYSDLAQPSVRKVGIALETVFEFSTSLLLPVKLLNEKFKLNFEKNLNSYKKKLDEIPEHKICKVNPQLGTPLIDKLSHTTNKEIANLFTSLLATASNIDTVNQAHPSFIHIIERLSVDEARIIKYLNGKDVIPSITILAYFKDEKYYEVINENATMLQYQVNLIFPQNIDVYLDNLISLGILSIGHGMTLNKERVYQELIKKYDLEGLNERYKKVGFGGVKDKCSYYKVTKYGMEFVRTVLS